jgi:hypothetical protein
MLKPQKKRPPGRLGFSEHRTDEFVRQREQLYGEFFGPEFTVSHELLPMVPHVDVYTFAPQSGRDFSTLITGGMSDLPMHVPEGAPIRRAELVLYVDEPQELYVNLLRWLARLIHEQQTWMLPGSTMTNGNPPQPIFEESVLSCYTFLEPLEEPDIEFPSRLKLDGDAVGLLWVVPVSEAECEFVRERDLEEFYGLLEQSGHSLVLDAGRESYL